MAVPILYIPYSPAVKTFVSFSLFVASLGGSCFKAQRHLPQIQTVMPVVKLACKQGISRLN